MPLKETRRKEKSLFYIRLSKSLNQIALVFMIHIQSMKIN